MATERNKTLKQKKAMLAALEQSLGVVTTASKLSGVERRRHYEWLKKDKSYKKAVEDLNNIALDFAESQLHKRIQEGNVASTIFYLKCRGKNRGYVEKIEHETTIKGDRLNIKVNLKNDTELK